MTQSQPFPNIALALTEARTKQPGGFITQPWLNLLRVLWERSGGTFGPTRAGPVGFLGLSGWDDGGFEEGIVIPGPPGPPGGIGPRGSAGLIGPPGQDGEDGSDGMQIPTLPVPGATYASSPLSPTAPSSTSAVQMMGMAGAITPRTTGNVLINVSGTFIASAALVDQGIFAQIYYGTGVAPTNGAAVTGTAIGANISWTNPIAATASGDINVPFSLTALIPVAALGKALWLDIGAKSITTASVFSISGAVITAGEI
jgi:hypothetical protein